MNTNSKPVPTAVFSDGGMVPDGRPIHSRSILGGTYAWVQVNMAQGLQIASAGGLILPSQYGLRDITNNLTEMVAALSAIDAWPDGYTGVLYLDSEVTMNRIWDNWKLEGLPSTLVGWLRRVKRGAKVEQLSPQLVAGHPTQRDLARGYDVKRRPVSPWNVWVDLECQRFAQQYLEQRFEGRGV